MTQTVTATEFILWLEARKEEIEQQLEAGLASSSWVTAPEPLKQAVAHAFLGGGKRVRPALCILGCEATGAPRAAAWPAAIAVELIHAYSLVHDDLPCMDDDDLRRGRPTVHALYGEATGVLTGDALQTLAFEVLAQQTNRRAAAAQVLRLARAAGASGMVGGQQLDMQLEGQGSAASLEQVEQVHRGKTGALLAESFLLGVEAADADPEPWRPWAETVGRLFQATDDLLDATRSTEELGKTAGKDDSADKATLVAVLGLEEAQRYASRLVAEADRHLQSLPVHRHAAEMRALPAYLLERCR